MLLALFDLFCMLCATLCHPAEGQIESQQKCEAWSGAILHKWSNSYSRHGSEDLVETF
jgi:hypothetical protein